MGTAHTLQGRRVVTGRGFRTRPACSRVGRPQGCTQGHADPVYEIAPRNFGIHAERASLYLAGLHTHT